MGPGAEITGWKFPSVMGAPGKQGVPALHAGAPGLQNEMASSLVTFVASCTIVAAAISSSI